MEKLSREIIDIAKSLSVQYLAGSIISTSPIEGRGEVNQVFTIETSQQKAILRLNNQTELEKFHKEQWCAEVAVSQDIPCPHVLAVGQNGEYAYMLLEYIEGQNGSEIYSSPELWHTLGQYLRKIHEITVKGFGENLEQIRAGNESDWNKYLNYNIESLTANDCLLQMGVINKNQLKKLRESFSSLLERDFNFGLNHGDYSLANVIVNKESVPYIIDWGSAQAHVVPHYDLSIILDESLEEHSAEFRSVLSGYGLGDKDYQSMRNDINILRILEAVDKVRWSLDRAPDRLTHTTKRLKNLLQHSVF